jgi:hypothetical protein
MGRGGVRLMKYAQIDGSGICVGISNLSDEVDNPNLIPISDGFAPIGQTFRNGTWIDSAPPPPRYKPLTKMQAMALLKQYGNIDDAAELVMRKDVNLELFWMRWRDDVPTTDINRDSPLTSATLAALVATGHITQAQSDAIMTNWPTE